MLDLHSKYQRLSDNALRAYKNCKDKKFKKFWLKVYDSIEKTRINLHLEQIPRQMN